MNSDSSVEAALCAPNRHEDFHQAKKYASTMGPMSHEINKFYMSSLLNLSQSAPEQNDGECIALLKGR